jgi:CheY-like chemotaxis protein
MTVRLPTRHDTRRNVAANVENMPTQTTGAGLSLEGSTVVVVDDQPDSRELLAALLESGGARVRQCESAAAALQQLTKPGVDLLVADIAMPEVDGYELIRLVRKLPEHVPAITVSAHARPQDRAKALVSGFDGYCAKPIEADHFFEMVQKVLPD